MLTYTLIHTRAHTLQPGPGVADWKAELNDNVDHLEREYDVLLNGNAGETGEDFPFRVTAAAFASPIFSNLFYVVSPLCHECSYLLQQPVSCGESFMVRTFAASTLSNLFYVGQSILLRLQLQFPATQSL